MNLSPHSTDSGDRIIIAVSSLFLKTTKKFRIEERGGLRYIRACPPRELTGCRPISDAVVT